MSEEQKLRKHIGVGYAGRVAKAAFVGIAALTAGVSADAHVGTALVSPDGGNATERHEKGFSNLSNQTNLERSLRNVTPEELKQMGVKNPERFLENVQKLEQNLQQREQKRAQRQEMRRLVEEAQKNPEVLKSLSKLFEEMPKQESSEVKRSAEKRQPSEQVSQSTKETHQQEQGKTAKWQALMDKIKVHPEARKLLASKEASPPGSEIAPTSNEDIHTQDASGPCLQWNLDTSRVTGTEIPVSDGTALQVVYSLHVQNICSDPVDNILYGAIENWQCPEGCVSSSGINTPSFDGLPLSIGQNQFSAGIWNDKIWCVQPDNNGNPVDVPPTSVTVAASVQGEQNGSKIYGPEVTFEVVP
jgi:hypothetical protein